MCSGGNSTLPELPDAAPVVPPLPTPPPTQSEPELRPADKGQVPFETVTDSPTPSAVNEPLPRVMETPFQPEIPPPAAAPITPEPPAMAFVPVMPPAPVVPAAPMEQRITLCQQLADAIRSEMHKAVVGQEELVEMLTVAVLAGGHVLLEGVPGTAKTLSIRTLARIFDVSFARIQFTPDLMPSDILGTSIFDPRTQEFHLKKGPLFAGLILADEVNRTPPKTQSALLEAMEERRVTIDGISHDLPEPFLVCATQNPVEYEGTYPLPEAQLDRFMLKVNVAYPSADEERAILARVQGGFRAQNLDTAHIGTILTGEGLAPYRDEIERVRVEPPVLTYIVAIARATRENRHLLLGASPRAAITLLLTSKALAAMRGRVNDQGQIYVSPDEVKALARPVLRHRVMLRPESEIEGYDADRLIDGILQSVEVPR
jgi:MoxR-like ATPase